MVTNQLLRNILKIIADLSHNDVNTNVFDTTVVEHSNLSSEALNRLQVELSSLGLIKMLNRRGDEEKSKNILEYWTLHKKVSKNYPDNTT